ncbi:MAG: dockerin type I domain-containing protein [Planctomycetota bacterium]
MIDDRANARILLLASAFVLGMGCSFATGITFYVGTANPQDKCGGADLDKNCEVSFTDFAILARYWLESNCAGSNDCGGADLVRNNTVNIADLSRLARNWLCELNKTIKIGLSINNYWMYQNLPTATKSNLIANAAVIDDPLSNSSYSYQWEFLLPSGVSLPPDTLSGGGSGDPSLSFAANDCRGMESISDSGQLFKVIVTITGNDYGNTGTAEQVFGIALLGDVNNDCRVDLADRSIINTFWRTGSAGKFTSRDCDLNCDGSVDVSDRSIANVIWQGMLCLNEVSRACPLR